MSTQSIDSMTDLERDAAVAREVMGEEPVFIWIARDDDDKPDNKSVAYVSTSRDGPFYDKRAVEKWIAEHPVVCGKRIRLGKWEWFRAYSTDMGAAWSIIEKVRNDPPEWVREYAGGEPLYFGIHTPAHNCGSAPASGAFQAGWIYSVQYEGESFVNGACAIHANPARCIAEAALKAVRGSSKTTPT